MARIRRPKGYVLAYLALLIYMTARSVVFTIGPVTEFQEGPIKTSLLFAAYLLAGGQALYFFRSTERQVGRLLPYLMLVAMVFVTAPLGDLNDALLRGGHAVGLFLIAVVTFRAFRNDYDGFLRLVFWFTFGCLLASIALAIGLPSRGLQNLANNNTRWIGVTQHPNLLGGLDILCAWSWLARANRAGLSVMRIARGSVTFVVIAATAYFSDSRTSQLALLVLFAIFFMMWGRRVYARRRAVRLYGGGLALIGVAAAIFLLALGEPVFRTREGADDVLSGRPEIWRVGLESVVEHPLGISFDDLSTFWRSTVSDSYKGSDAFTHFHNGYLDVTAKGGLMSGIILLVMLAVNWLAIWRTRRIDYTRFVGCAALFITLVVYNMQETSFMREILVWAVQIMDWALLPFAAVSRRAVRRVTPRPVGIATPARR